MKVKFTFFITNQRISAYFFRYFFEKHGKKIIFHVIFTVESI